MLAKLCEDVRQLEAAVRALEGGNRQDDAARRAVCIHSRFVWQAVRSLSRTCPDALSAAATAEILSVFERATEALKGVNDVCYRNVCGRFRGDMGISATLDELSSPHVLEGAPA